MFMGVPRCSPTSFPASVIQITQVPFVSLSLFKEPVKICPFITYQIPAGFVDAPDLIARGIRRLLGMENHGG
jgi:hypothetical protein